MKKLILFALLFAGIHAFAQPTITNQKTDQHTNIKGTQSFVIAPAGFEPALNFSGLQHNASGASIMLVEVPAPYNQITADFTKEAMKAKGMELAKKDDYIINGSQAMLIRSTQFSPAHGYNFAKYSLIVHAGANKTLLANANVPEGQAETMEANILQSLLSVYIDKDVVTDSFASVDFTVDLSKSAFKLVNSMSGTLMLEGPNSELMIIAKSIKQFDAADKKGAVINALKQVSTIIYVSFVSGKEVMQDDASGYQLLANVTTKKGDKPMQAFTTMLFGNNYYYMFLALVNVHDNKLVKDAEHIISTFKRK